MEQEFYCKSFEEFVSKLDIIKSMFENKQEDKDIVISLKEKKVYRTIQQNKFMHANFQDIATFLNESGLKFESVGDTVQYNSKIIENMLSKYDFMSIFTIKDFCEFVANMLNENGQRFTTKGFSLPYSADIVKSITKNELSVKHTSNLSIKEFCEFMDRTFELWQNTTKCYWQPKELARGYLLRTGLIKEDN